jgi:hypothetical protein
MSREREAMSPRLLDRDPLAATVAPEKGFDMGLAASGVPATEQQKQGEQP